MYYPFFSCQNQPLHHLQSGWLCFSPLWVSQKAYGVVWVIFEHSEVSRWEWITKRWREMMEMIGNCKIDAMM